MASDLRRLVRKLQQALAIQQGRHISLSTYQMYSQKAGRTCTKYIISEQQPEGGYKKLLATWSLPDIVKALANELQGGQQPADVMQGDNSAGSDKARQNATQPRTHRAST